MSELSWFGFVGLAALIIWIGALAVAPLVIALVGWSALVGALPTLIVALTYVSVLSGTLVYFLDRFSA